MGETGVSVASSGVRQPRCQSRASHPVLPGGETDQRFRPAFEQNHCLNRRPKCRPPSWLHDQKNRLAGSHAPVDGVNGIGFTCMAPPTPCNGDGNEEEHRGYTDVVNTGLLAGDNLYPLRRTCSQYRILRSSTYHWETLLIRHNLAATSPRSPVTSRHFGARL